MPCPMCGSSESSCHTISNRLQLIFQKPWIIQRWITFKKTKKNKSPPKCSVGPFSKLLASWDWREAAVYPLRSLHTPNRSHLSQGRVKQTHCKIEWIGFTLCLKQIKESKLRWLVRKTCSFWVWNTFNLCILNVQHAFFSFCDFPALAGLRTQVLSVGATRQHVSKGVDEWCLQTARSKTFVWGFFAHTQITHKYRSFLQNVSCFRIARCPFKL